MLEEKPCQPRIRHLAKLYFKSEEKKNLHWHTKLRMFVDNLPYMINLKELFILKGPCTKFMLMKIKI